MRQPINKYDESGNFTKEYLEKLYRKYDRMKKKQAEDHKKFMDRIYGRIKGN